MDDFFKFTNSDLLEDSNISNFVKSQIMHFYFVYVHPYFDVNGRTSRTVSMWKLLNNKNYPYIIFNRAISNNKSGYEKSLIKGRKTSDMTAFLKYMIKSVRNTLEMELVLQSIIKNSNKHITRDDSEMIEYILMMNGYLTLKDLKEEYNRHNDAKNRFKIFKENIVPLIDKNIILLKDKVKDGNNYYFKLNGDLIDTDDRKIKTFKLDKYI